MERAHRAVDRDRELMPGVAPRAALPTGLGAADDGSGSVAVPRSAGRPHARANQQQLTERGERPLEHLEDAPRHREGLAGPGVDEHHRELVAADAGDLLEPFHTAPYTRADLAEDGVADLVSERVVGVFEVVEIEEQHAQGGSPPFGARERVAKPLAEEETVRELGRDVEVGEPLELGL